LANSQLLTMGPYGRGASGRIRAMARRADFARVRRVGLTVPGLEEGKAWNGPCLKANSKIAACMATHKSAEPGTLVVVVGEDVRDELIEGDPEVYYLRDHYTPWPTVLVRLALIDDGVLRDLLMMAARYRSADPGRRARSRRQ
jgi:hypothetical protein